MTYIKTFLPKIDELKKQLEENPQKIWIYQKYDVYLGDKESIEFLQTKLKKFQQ